MKCSANVLIIPSRAVAATDPLAPWIGGKRRLAQRICGVIAATPHTAYAEPFIGMGGVFLRRRVRPSVEVINDVSRDVVTLFRVLQRFPHALMHEMRWRPAIRTEFDRLKTTRDDDLLDIERAARFVYLQTLAFGGKAVGRNFGTDAKQPQNVDLARLTRRVEALHDRLSGVVIENLDWSDFISRYDRATTLFYLDPPYWGCEDDYGTGIFTPDDFQQMADQLRAADGRFLLSINDVPELREMFAWADVEGVQTKYSLAGPGGTIAAAELLIGRGVELAPALAQASLL